MAKAGVSREMVEQAVFALLPPVENLTGKLVDIQSSDPGMEWSTHIVGYFPTTAEQFVDFVVDVLGLKYAVQLPDEVDLELFGQERVLGGSPTDDNLSSQELFFEAKLFEPKMLGSRE